VAVKELNGKVLTDYIKQRQAKLGRRLEAEGIKPKLAVVMTTDNPVIDSYVKMKRRYGREIGVEVDIQKVAQADLKTTIQANNDNPNVHAMIIQLPLDDPVRN
jgi:methylenetetrahydrofolate dehydrogenase (NADP+)/methenyltetrahydrofolate cyclohydrolase